MNVLVLGTDRTVFLTEECFGDTRKRHIAYARRLRERCGDDSEIRFISLSPIAPEYEVQTLPHGLTLYPTRSIHRATFFLDIVRLLPTVLRGWKPDLITVQGPWEEGTLGFLLSRLLGVKYLPQIHINIFAETWRKEHWLNPWRFFVGSNWLRRADGVRVVSQALKEEAIAWGGISEERISVVPVGVNFTPADPRKGKDHYKAQIAPRLAGRKTVLFVGRFVAQKNLDLWLDVAESVLRDRPDVCFLLAGDGHLFTHIKERVKAKGVEESFYFLGSIAHARLPDLYAAADVFLLTSDYEGYGRVIVEAFLAGVPVISTRSTGPEDLIRDQVDGYLVPVGSRDPILDRVQKLLADSATAERMGEAGRERMMQEFSLETLVERLIGCWIDICDAPPGRTPATTPLARSGSEQSLR